ncbi:Quinidine resistance protein 2 [Cytospora mali]|uniref:Quinidine resistance protein 2 n=1 Tax=Cytospora mali TaxID=578113 RepID=A0A194VTV5_CYTMA|nr:Quinidine resistance protein 2 [Valsa mali]
MGGHAGEVVNRDYQITAKRNGMVIDRLRGDDISAFPIEHARLRTLKYAIAICAPLVATYGWVLQVKANMAVPLVLRFLIGFTNQPLYNSLNTLMVDYHPDRSDSVQAANNLVRCELAAAGLAVLDVMIMKMGPGWCFVVFAALHGVTLPVLFILERRGVAWRQKA